MNEPVSGAERNWAMFSHLAGLLVMTHLPFANVIGPLVCYLQARSQSSRFVIEHARASLNFQITFSIAIVVGFIVGFTVVGASLTATLVSSGSNNSGPPLAVICELFGFVALLLFAVLGDVVSCVLGAIAASSGHSFRYPLAIPFVRDETQV